MHSTAVSGLTLYLPPHIHLDGSSRGFVHAPHLHLLHCEQIIESSLSSNLSFLSGGPIELGWLFIMLPNVVGGRPGKSTFSRECSEDLVTGFVCNFVGAWTRGLACGVSTYSFCLRGWERVWPINIPLAPSPGTVNVDLEDLISISHTDSCPASSWQPENTQSTWLV